MKLNFYNIIQALAFHVYYNRTDHTSNCDYRTILSGSLKFIDLFNERLLKNGKKWTLSRYKSIYLGTKGFILDQENFQSNLNPFIATNKNGIPLELVQIKHFLNGENPGIRVIMTVLRLYESIKLPVEFDPKPIIDDYKGKPLEPLINDFKSFSKKGIIKFKPEIRRLLDLSNLFPHESSYRFKNGPMGPSILTSHLDAYAIMENDKYRETFKRYCYETASVKLLSEFYHSYNMCTKTDPSIKLRTGKISMSSQAAGKTRLFAICNFGVQSALKPLHDSLMKILKKFPSDGTFDQIGQFNRILEKSKNHKTYCFDLSKATDRFPIKLQKSLLSVIVNNTFAKSGNNLMTVLPFSKDNEDYLGKVGQPLGAYSSGAMFAFTHHLVVQYCSYKSKNRILYFKNYALLGDDIVIGDKRVALEYQNFMNYISVDINKQKSIVDKINSGEFANRLFGKGNNISGFGYQMAMAAIASPAGGLRFQEILEMEGFREKGALCLYPGSNNGELSPKLTSQISGLGTLRNCFAHGSIMLIHGNITISYRDLLQSYIEERIRLLYKQLTSSLKRSQYLRVVSKIKSLSQRWGVTAKESCLDICFIDDELVSHPIVRYLNVRNELIFEKIEKFNDNIHDSLFSQDSILALSSYTAEEYIPSMTLDTFFVEDINELKFKIKTSTQSKSISSLMKTIKDLETDGENFQQ